MMECALIVKQFFRIKKGAVKYARAFFHSPFAGRWPRVACGRKIARAFFFELIKIKPEI
jgi:hypothetical protein